MRSSADEVRFSRPARLPGLELVDASYRSRAFPVHSHEEYVIGVTTAGAEQLSIRGQHWMVRPGDFILIEPGEAHANWTASEHGVAYRVFYIPAVLLSEFSGSIRFARNVVAGDGLARKWALLHREWMGHDELELQSQFFDLLAQILAIGGSANPRAGRAEQRPVARARDYLDARFKEPVGLTDLARIAGLSPYHFLRSFREQVGLTPGAYHIQLRVSEARRRLRDGAAIADTAAELGFADQSHLSRHFQRIFGTSPGRYAQQ
jgi:AraC-like DNA-binding protein